MPPPGRGEPWWWAWVPEMPSQDAPGLCLAAVQLSPSFCALPQLSALPSPTAKTTFPLSSAQTAHHVFPKKAIPTCPIYLWKGGAHSLNWPGHHVPAGGSLHFGAWSYWREKESSGYGSVCHPMLGYPFQQKPLGPLPLSQPGTPRCLIQRDFPLLGQDAKDPNPAGSMEVQMEWENSPRATTRNDYPTLTGSFLPFPKRACTSLLLPAG